MNTHSKKAPDNVQEKKEEIIKNGTDKHSNKDKTAADKTASETRKPFIKMPKKGKKEDTY